MRRTQGYIPRNLGTGTLWDGRLKARNAVEAVIICAVVYGLTKILGLFLPYLVTISIMLVLWVLLGGLALVGIYGEPLSIYVLTALNYSNTRTYVTLRPPQRQLPEAEKKSRRQQKMMAEAEKKQKRSLADRIFIGGAKKSSEKTAKGSKKPKKKKIKKQKPKKQKKEGKKSAKKKKEQA